VDGRASGAAGCGRLWDVSTPTAAPLMLLDSASLYFRAYFGVPESMTAPDGTPINAVRGFLDMVATLVSRFAPQRLVACLDVDWRPAWRVELVPSYKAHRLADGSAVAEAIPETLTPQVPILLDVLAAFGIATAGAAGYEADDVIGSLAEREKGPVDVVTGDRDLFQLVDDERAIRVLYTGRGVAKLEIVDSAEVRRRYGVGPEQYSDFAVLRGDPSDGLPGVAGIGEKTASSLLGAFGDLDSLLAALDRGGVGVPPAQGRKLAASRDYLAVAPRVVQVARDIALPDVDDALPVAPADRDALVALAERWGLVNSIHRVVTALTAVSRSRR
jgi:5'-3' exonuclease